MNRELMARQMFAKGGAAFPDLSGDGQVTQKDILMGRGVIPMQEGGVAPGDPEFASTPRTEEERRILEEMYRQQEAERRMQEGLDRARREQEEMDRSYIQQFMDYIKGRPEFSPGDTDGGSIQDFAYGGQVNYMQEGGMAPVNPMVGMPAPQDSAMPPMAQAGGIDPAIMEQMLMQAQQSMTSLDDAESAEEVMNAMRGDEASVEERRMELADIVGPEDAQQTPESVLTLVQPVMMMAQVDQGIGGLAQEQMGQPVSGDMAQGIMSTVDMGAEEGPAPVNFKYGGVVGMQAGGDPLTASYQSRLPLYEQIAGIDPAEIQRQKELDQAQMLFALAQGGLQLASPADRRMSTAEKLALAGQGVLQNISGITAGAAQRKAQQDAIMRQAKFGALQAAEADLTAKAKAAQELKIQEIKGAQDLAKMERQAVLDTNVQSVLEGLKQRGRIELKGIEGAQNMTLEELKQSGAITLEDYRQVNRQALQQMQNDNAKDIELLRQSGQKDNLVLADKLEKENIKIRANIKLNEMNVANEYDLAKMDKAHEQAIELNNTNNALKEKLADLDREISNRRLELDTKRAEVDQAQGERKLELQAEVNRMQSEMNAFEKQYKTDKLDIERVAARLTRLGTSTDARITTLVSDPERITAYAMGTLGPEETLELNQAIAYYNAPKSVWSEEKKAFVIVPGNPLSNELQTAIRIRQDNQLSIPNIKLDGGSPSDTSTTDAGTKEDQKEVVVSQIMKGIEDPQSAFGTEGFLKNFANTVAEVFFFGAPFKAEKEAIAGSEALNTKFVQVFQRSAELRDSVMQLQMLKDLVPSPKNLFMGPEAAGAKVTRVLGMIDEAEEALRTKLEDPNSPLTAAQVSEAQGYLTDLSQLKAGYKVFDNAYKQMSASDEKVDALRKMLNLGNRSKRED